MTMKRSTASRTAAQRWVAHRALERKASALAKKAEAAHQQHRQAKAAYKAAKKAARSAKVAWHRSKISARDAQRALTKSAKRLARHKGSAASENKARPSA